jgi:hypothetical protein
MNSSVSATTSRTIRDKNKDHEELITITEKIDMTKNQYEVLNIICNTYEESVSQYLQEALVEAMRFDIEEGNFSEVLLEKLGEDNRKKETESTQSSTLKDELDKLHKQQMP